MLSSPNLERKSLPVPSFQGWEQVFIYIQRMRTGTSPVPTQRPSGTKQNHYERTKPIEGLNLLRDGGFWRKILGRLRNKVPFVLIAGLLGGDASSVVEPKQKPAEERCSVREEHVEVEIPHYDSTVPETVVTDTTSPTVTFRATSFWPFTERDLED